MQTKQLGLILLIALLAISLVTASLPYTTSQFINQTTDLNETNYFNGNFDGQVLFIDGNIISAKTLIQVAEVRQTLILKQLEWM